MEQVLGLFRLIILHLSLLATWVVVVEEEVVAAAGAIVGTNKIRVRFFEYY